MPMPKGCDSDLALSAVLHPDAVKKLTRDAKKLTLGDTWRMSGWGRPGDTAPNDDAVLKNLSMKDMKSIAEALEVHLKKNGNTQRWKYVNPTYACGACCACCAVAVQPSARR